MTESSRCGWATTPRYVDYHDRVWGMPCHQDQELFYMLILEGMQAGLSWSTILNKWDNFFEAFDQFDPEIIQNYDEQKIESLMNDAGIIRNRRKILAAIDNAKAFLAVQKEFGSFAQYIWSFVDGNPIQNHWQTLEEVPATTEISEQMSKELKKRGFKFVGPTIMYAYMQAVGMVNDHLVTCPSYKKCQKAGLH